MTLLGSNINSELFMEDPIGKTLSYLPHTSSYILKGETEISNELEIKTPDQGYSISKLVFTDSINKLKDHQNIQIHKLSDEHSKLFNDIMEALTLAKLSNPIYGTLLNLIEQNYPQSSIGIGTVSSYFTNNKSSNIQPHNITSIFNTDNNCKDNVMIFDDELYSINPKESHTKHALIYIENSLTLNTNAIKQLQSNNIETIKIFKDFNSTTKNYGFISDNILVSSLVNTSVKPTPRGVLSSQKSTTTTTTTTNTNTGCVFVIILLIILILIAAIVYRNNY
jgi:hypothetical protein